MMSKFLHLAQKINTVVPTLGDWCSLERAYTLSAIVIANRPAISLEIGVWMGGSCVPIALAHQAINFGRVIAIDAWDAKVSIEGQINPEDKKWWLNAPHQKAKDKFVSKLSELNLTSIVEVVQARSQDYVPPKGIELFSLDGNHGEESLLDVVRYIPYMAPHGIVAMDDYDWAGGNVRKACTALESLGWIEYAKLGTGGLWRRK